jgi:hypothetical protein
MSAPGGKADENSMKADMGWMLASALAVVEREAEAPAPA